MKMGLVRTKARLAYADVLSVKKATIEPRIVETIERQSRYESSKNPQRARRRPNLHLNRYII